MLRYQGLWVSRPRVMKPDPQKPMIGVFMRHQAADISRRPAPSRVPAVNREKGSRG
ncbi:hypothetical protein K388_07107 [Streptomyces sp. KhCrAH-43]|nr:hypothetical protein K388_07107 [Streptomyces sp. KhCrAH-43]